MRRSGIARASGVTLPEVLTAVLIIMVIAGSVTAIYGAAMRTWYRGAAETYAEQKASWAIQRMVPDLREAMNVTPASSPYDAICVALELPAKTFDSSEGVYLNQVTTDAGGAPYLVGGDYAVYYRGDEHGNISLDGDRLWRRLARPNGTVVKQLVIADNVVDNPDDETGNPKPMFIYWPDIYRLRSVEVTVTVEETRGHRTERTTMVGEMALRNN
jgi:hypothetical protein